jgi:hypothetical protein
MGERLRERLGRDGRENEGKEGERLWEFFLSCSELLKHFLKSIRKQDLC